MNRAPLIHLGDVFRAIRRLAPATAEERRAMLNTLGFDLLEQRSGTDDRSSPPPVPVETANVGGPVGNRADTGHPDQGLDARPPEEEETAVLPHRVEGTAPVLRPWRNATPLGGFDPRRHVPWRMPHEPLFRPSWTRTILTDGLACSEPDGPVDTDALARRIARGLPITEVNRVLLRTMRRGVQVLIDAGEGMEPFARDQRLLAETIRRWFGRDRVDRLYFRGHPDEACGPGAVWDWAPYRPPRHGMPVLLLGDLGISLKDPLERSVIETRWLDLAYRLAVRGSRLVAFVPYPVGRWPEPIPTRIALVTWDRPTSAHPVRRALQRLAQRGRP